MTYQGPTSEKHTKLHLILFFTIYTPARRQRFDLILVNQVTWGNLTIPKDIKGRSVLLIIITNCKSNLYSRFRLELYCKCIEIRHPVRV